MPIDRRNLTLVFVKPDGVERSLVGEIISRFERRKLIIGAIKTVQVTADFAALHYAEHSEKPFFGDLIQSLTVGPIVAMILRGPDDQTVDVVRQIVGSTKNAAPGTIRGDYAEIDPIRNNIVHASDSTESAWREIELFFPEVIGEIYYDLG